MWRISSIKLTDNWAIQNFTRKYQMSRLKETKRKSTKKSTTVSTFNFHLHSLKLNENVSSIENLPIKWFRKIYSKNVLVIVKKMLLTMMAISNIDANKKPTDKSIINTKK